MSPIRRAAIVALLAIMALPAVAEAVPASGMALVGLAECTRGVAEPAADPPDESASSPEAMRADTDAAAASGTWLREYLHFHALAQEDSGARTALMPWPALRAHAN
jgi:hypothetical protein